MTTTPTPAPAAPKFRVVNPATGEIVEEFPSATGAEIQHALASAQARFELWRRQTIEERAAIVGRVAELLVERAAEFGAIMTQEMGKTLEEGIGEAEYAASIFTYYAENGPAFAADQEIPAAGGLAVIQRLPIGPILGIMPWNYPLYQVARFVAPNLVLGNTIVLKHAENCPRSALAIARLLADAGVPDGAYVNVFADHSQIADIIADPRIQGVSLTGSERAGAAVGELAGRNLKKAVLELGGSDPYIVLDSADVAAAAAAAWDTRLYNMGQSCNSNKRMIIMADIYDEFVAELVKLAAQLQPGDPRVGAAGTFAPLSSRRAAETLARQLETAVAQGATLHFGGSIVDGPGAYLQPAVLTGVTPSMDVHHEELFGPVAVVYRVSNDQEAVLLANDTPYGLGGAVFSADEHRASRLANQLDVGMTNVNTAAGEGPDMPFGGTKRSGFGRELGPLGMDEFVNKRLFYVN